MQIKLDWKRVTEIARAEILRRLTKEIDGELKMDQVVRAVLVDTRRRLDEVIEPEGKVAEAVSDAFIAGAMALARTAIHHLAQAEYDRMKAAGELSPSPKRQPKKQSEKLGDN